MGIVTANYTSVRLLKGVKTRAKGSLCCSVVGSSPRSWMGWSVWLCEMTGPRPHAGGWGSMDSGGGIFARVPHRTRRSGRPVSWICRCKASLKRSRVNQRV